MSRYSNDFRALVAKKLVLDSSAVSLETISKDFEVSMSSLKLWVKKLAAGTLYDVMRKGGHLVEYNLAGLELFVNKHPDKSIFVRLEMNSLMAGLVLAALMML